MDMESRRLWEQYTKVKETMLERTHIAEAPWWIIEEAVTLPERVHNPDYLRNPVPKEMFVPNIY
jgi:polyphosphate kinase 2 (PPK2 family)